MALTATTQPIGHRKGREVLAWAYERPDGGRGFGCTGGHFHKNWSNNDFRTLIPERTGLDDWTRCA